MKKQKHSDDTSSNINANDLKTCASCGEKGHSRASSQRCRNYQPRQGAQKPANENENEIYLEKKINIYKQGLATFTTYEFKNGEKLQDRIHQQVNKITTNSYYVTRLLNFHLQRCIERDITIPDITNRTWLRQLFTHKIRDENLQQDYRLIQDLLPPLQEGIVSQHYFVEIIQSISKFI